MTRLIALVVLALPLAGCVASDGPSRAFSAYVCPDGSPPLIRTAAEARERGKAMMGDSISRDDRYAYDAIDQEDYWLVYKRPIERLPAGHIENTIMPGRITGAIAQVEVSKCAGFNIGVGVSR